MNQKQVDKILTNSISPSDCMVEEEMIVNMLGNLIGDMSKQLTSFADSKDKQRQKMIDDLGTEDSDIIRNFTKATEKMLKPREVAISKFKYIWNYFLLTRTWDNVETRRKIKAFSNTIENNMFVDGKMTLHLMDAQRDMFMNAYEHIQQINESSKEFTTKQGIEI